MTIAFMMATPGTASAAEERFLILQSTTSTQNSGLFDFILPIFEKSSGIDVRVVAVGTGQAIRNAANGDGDILLVHSKEAEEAFVKSGHGIARHDVMYNDFVIVGPKEDPADISSAQNAVAALDRIAKSGAIFASRGDDSGTHKAERKLWDSVGLDIDAQSGKWYRETGSGMGATLNVAVEMRAYVLTDRATWASFGNKAAHEILLENDPSLVNQYGIIRVDPERHKNVRKNEAEEFETWLLSLAGQMAIAAFVIEGEQLFFPNAKSSLTK